MKRENILNIDEISVELKKINVKYNENRKSVVVIGSGFGGYMACEDFENKNIEVLFVCDNNPKTYNDKFYWSKRNKKWIGVCSMDKLYEIGKETLCSISPRMDYTALAQQLEQMGIDNYVNHFAFIRSFSLESIIDVYNKLTREKSKYIMEALLTVDLTGDTGIYTEICEQNQYFGIPEFTYVNSDEVMCEAGAYVGETIEQYIWKKQAIFKKIIAFEPGKKEFEAMKIRIKRLNNEWALDDDKIVMINAALGNEDKTLNAVINNSHGIRLDGIGSESIDVIRLDSFISDDKVSLIIADIEGAEISMIEGMEQVIIRDRPKIAIAIYHRANDIFEIPKKLLSLHEDYRFDIVHHYVGSSETVLYAY